MHRLMGIETEYGLYVEGKGAADQVMEAMAVVRAFPGSALAAWDYRAENPRKDMRGFQVSHLQTDPEDMKFEQERPTRLPDYEVKSDRVLPNGARLYNDHGHPEYSTPECVSLADLVAHDKAGEQIMRLCAHAYSQRTNYQVSVYKNNSDFHGASYGTHENYLFQRKLPFEKLQSGLLPFMVTRILYAGAGKVGVENDAAKVPFQLSQRADFFMEEANVETLYKRPIINTRDEPHAYGNDWRRLHVICGDANMSEYTTALKAGTTELALSLLDLGWMPAFQIKEPVKTIKAISRDQSWRWLITLEDGLTMPAVDVQREYWQAADHHLRGRDAQTDWILDEWKDTLDTLEKAPRELADRIDWVAKRTLLESFLESEGEGWDSDLARSADLEYHNIEPEEGLYYGLESQGQMQRVVTDERIDHAMNEAPANTRAFLRGLCISRFADRIETLSWGRITLRDGEQSVQLDLGSLVGEDLYELNQALSTIESITDFVKIANNWNAKS